MLSRFLENVLIGLSGGVEVIFDFYFLWLPLFLWLLAFGFWKRYITTEKIFSTDKGIMQIKLPRDIQKSPRAMELFLNSLWQTSGEGNFYDKWWKGGTRPWTSLELVSIEGEVRFYIWARKAYLKGMENGLYAQFPNIEVITDAVDYTNYIRYNPEKNKMYGTLYELVNDNVYPIKTYVDFGLDQDPKEEFRIDPMAPVIEYLGSIGKGEQVWIQILVRAHKNKKEESIFSKIKDLFKPGSKSKYKDWKKEGEEVVTKLLDEVPKDEEGVAKGVVKQTKQKERIIEALERSLSKPAFDTLIRGIYISDIDAYDKGTEGGLKGLLTPYASDGLNAFKPTKKTDFDYPWEDFGGGRVEKKKRDIFEDYIKRSRFETRYNFKDFILTSEELATIYHFPGSNVETPNLPRIESTKAQPPTNIPI